MWAVSKEVEKERETIPGMIYFTTGDDRCMGCVEKGDGRNVDILHNKFTQDCLDLHCPVADAGFLEFFFLLQHCAQSARENFAAPPTFD